MNLPYGTTPGEAVIIQTLQDQNTILNDIRTYLQQLVERPQFDPQAPVNAYGENFTDAIQNSLVRGQRGIHTHGS